MLSSAHESYTFAVPCFGPGSPVLSTRRFFAEISVVVVFVDVVVVVVVVVVTICNVSTMLRLE